jgi:hypothetical protein
LGKGWVLVCGREREGRERRYIGAYSLYCTIPRKSRSIIVNGPSGRLTTRERFWGYSQHDPDGTDEGDGSPEKAADEPHHLADPMHDIQQLARTDGGVPSLISVK